MKYKLITKQQQLFIEQLRLLYALAQVTIIKAKKELENKVVHSPVNELPKGNRDTKIHFIFDYKNMKEFRLGMDLANKIIPLDIVDEVNIHLPVEYMKRSSDTP